MIAPDSPAPFHIHSQKPNKAVVPSILPDCSHYLRFLIPLFGFGSVYQALASFEDNIFAAAAYFLREDVD